MLAFSPIGVLRMEIGPKVLMLVLHMHADLAFARFSDTSDHRVSG